MPSPRVITSVRRNKLKLPVRAELTIEHADGDLVAALEAVLGPHDATALAQSLLAQKSPASGSAITYSSYGPAFLVMAWPTPRQLYLYIESSGGRLRRAAGDVWELVQNGGTGLCPNLKSLVLLDEDANDEIATAAVGFEANLQRPEVRYTLWTGLATGVWLALALTMFSATGNLVLGAIPALLAALIAAVVLVVDSRKKRLVWR